jgi:hypothetical protein
LSGFKRAGELTGFSKRVCGGQEGIPQGLKPRFKWKPERPKAEALGYLEAKTSILEAKASILANASILTKTSIDQALGGRNA